jgi:ribosomal protein S27AE
MRLAGSSYAHITTCFAELSKGHTVDNRSDEFDDNEYPDPDYDDDSDDVTQTVRCPNCGTDVYEDAEQCPTCGEYVVMATSAWEGKPLPWVLIGLAGIVAVIMTLSGC